MIWIVSFIALVLLGGAVWLLLGVLAEVTRLTAAVEDLASRGPGLMQALAQTQLKLEVSQGVVEELVEVLDRPAEGSGDLRGSFRS
jgi:hypothetical protein